MGTTHGRDGNEEFDDEEEDTVEAEELQLSRKLIKLIVKIFLQGWVKLFHVGEKKGVELSDKTKNRHVKEGLNHFLLCTNLVLIVLKCRKRFGRVKGVQVTESSF